MRLAIMTAALLDRPLDAALDAIAARDVHVVEVPAGGYFPKTHCDPAQLLQDNDALARFRDAFRSRDLSISALAIHGNPVHPSAERRAAYEREFLAACELAEKLGVTRLTLLAGLPGGGPADQTPNWIVAPFPPEYESMLRWQWDECVLPYWRDASRFAASHGVRLCFEMVPADCVYNPRTLLRLRQAIGATITCNLDPSHLFFQGIDPLAAIGILGPAIAHVHAKDARIDTRIAAVDGLLEPLPYPRVEARSWSYRTVGYGHGVSFWADFASALRTVGYDDVVSIEHEDNLMSAEEGLDKALAMLRLVVPFETREAGWWAAPSDQPVASVPQEAARPELSPHPATRHRGRRPS